jgi:hypothetical protein
VERVGCVDRETGTRCGKLITFDFERSAIAGSAVPVPAQVTVGITDRRSNNRGDGSPSQRKQTVDLRPTARTLVGKQEVGRAGLEGRRAQLRGRGETAGLRRDKIGGRFVPRGLDFPCSVEDCYGFPGTAVEGDIASWQHSREACKISGWGRGIATEMGKRIEEKE